MKTFGRLCSIQRQLRLYTTHALVYCLLLYIGPNHRFEIVDHFTSCCTDFYWGDGGDGSGENQLGKILMLVRGKLRRELDMNGSINKRKREKSSGREPKRRAGREEKEQEEEQEEGRKETSKKRKKEATSTPLKSFDITDLL